MKKMPLVIVGGSKEEMQRKIDELNEELMAAYMKKGEKVKFEGVLNLEKPPANRDNPLTTAP